MKGRGRSRELRVVELLRDAGHVTYRLAHGCADVIALGGGLERPLLVQVKSTAGGPYERFEPQTRRTLALEAARADADAVLCWWPPGRGVPIWIDSTDWPRLRAVA
jgi:Holliday junction resolvase